MNDKEFEELIERLHRLSAIDGDIGHEYWTKVIRQLTEMRAMLRLHEKTCPKMF